MSAFFVRRPIVAMVIAIVMTIVGAVAMVQLPIAQFPDIAPPEVQLSATYTGADALTIETWEATTIPAPEPRKVTGLDGKTYTRPQTTGPKEAQKETPMSAAPSRLAIPQPPKYGGNRPKHNQVIGNVIVSAQGLCIVADEIQALDGSINSEEAASYADDLSRIIRSLKRIQQLLTKEV